jgi:hypothetical protein
MRFCLLFLDELTYSTNKTKNFDVVGLYCLLVLLLLVIDVVEETSVVVEVVQL